MQPRLAATLSTSSFRAMFTKAIYVWKVRMQGTKTYLRYTGCHVDGCVGGEGRLHLRLCHLACGGGGKGKRT